MRYCFFILCLLLFAAHSCHAQFDTLIYYGANGKIVSSKWKAQQYIKIKGLKKNKKETKLNMSTKFNMYTVRKYEGEWYDAMPLHQFWKVNDSTFVIHTIKNGESVDSKMRMFYEDKPDVYYIADYNRSGTLMHEGWSTSLFPLHRIGEHKEYYGDGTLYEVSSYKDNQMFANRRWDKEGNELMRNVFSSVDTMPKIDESEQDMVKYIGQMLKDTLTQEAKSKLSGIVGVTFIVTKEGGIDEVYISRGRLSAEGNAIVLDLIRSLDKWTPAYLDGKPVNVQYNLPMHLRFY